MKKQKVVIKVWINYHTSKFWCFGPQSSHSKALRLAAGFPGVQSVALLGDQDRIEVTGEMDVVNLATLLRKKVGLADIVSVGEDKKKDQESKDVRPIVWPYPRQETVYARDPYPQSWCCPL